MVRQVGETASAFATWRSSGAAVAAGLRMWKAFVGAGPRSRSATATPSSRNRSQPRPVRDRRDRQARNGNCRSQSNVDSRDMTRPSIMTGQELGQRVDPRPTQTATRGVASVLSTRAGIDASCAMCASASRSTTTPPGLASDSTNAALVRLADRGRDRRRFRSRRRRSRSSRACEGVAGQRTTVTGVPGDDVVARIRRRRNRPYAQRPSGRLPARRRAPPRASLAAIVRREYKCSRRVWRLKSAAAQSESSKTYDMGMMRWAAFAGTGQRTGSDLRRHGRPAWRNP